MAARPRSEAETSRRVPRVRPAGSPSLLSNLDTRSVISIPTPLAAFVFAVFALAAPAALPQANVIPGTDVKLGRLEGLTALGRTGTYPDGMNGLAMSTTACNVGTVNVPWLAPMQSDHPCIGFLIVRERNNRMVQISDWSFVKHGFFALSGSQCTPCQSPSPGGTWLGKGCSDTYSTMNNGDSYWLGPPSEVDPWLHIWNPVCSYFDKGFPPVSAPNDCDGLRSLSQTMVNNMGPVANRIRVSDADLNSPGMFYYQAMYVIRGEAEALREDNIGSKRFTPTWSNNSWAITTNDSAITYGSVLTRWSGATVTSATNGNSDGRVYIGVKVTGPVNGLYHYEYAIHNRDNGRGFSSFRLPVPVCGTFSNVGFRDIDGDPGNDWTFAQGPAEISFETATNPLRWNSIYNFWFDSPAAPVVGQPVVLDQFKPGAGASSVTVLTTVPGGLPFTSFGTGTPGCQGAHHVCAVGSPSVGNGSFLLTCDRAPASALGLGIAADVKDAAGSDPFGLGITLYIDFFLAGDLQTLDFASDASGFGAAAAPIPNDPLLAGKPYTIQAVWAWSPVDCVPSPFGLSASDAIELVILP